jgi:hypothetical protein
MEVIVPKPNTDKINLILNNFNESQSFLQSSGYTSEWTSWENAYRSVPKGGKEPWMYNIHTGATYSQVQAAHSQLMSLFFATNPNFDVKPREKGDNDQAMLTKRLISYQMDEARFKFEYGMFLKNLCIFGTSIGKEFWDRRFDLRTEWTAQFEQGTDITGNPLEPQFAGVKPQQNKVLAFDGPRFINCNLNDIFPDPTSIEIQDGWVIHRTNRTIDYLRQMHETYPDIYNEEVLKLVDADGTNINQARSDLGSATNRLITPPVTRPEGTSSIELLERWGMDIDPADGKLKPRVETLAAGKYLVRSTNNPDWAGQNPFIKGTYIPIANDFYGIGIPELLEDLQNAQNEVINQRMDNISFAINRMGAFKKGSGIKLKNLKSEPGLMVGVEEEIDSCIKFFDMPLYTRDSFAQAAEIGRLMQEKTGVTSLTLGMGGPSQNSTATGMAQLSQASGQIFLTIAKMIEFGSFTEAIKQFYQLDYQYITDEQLIGVLGQDGAMEWLKISPDAIRKNYDFVPSGIFSMENKSQKSLRLIQFKNITKDDPTIKQHVINKKIYEAMEIGDDSTEIMLKESEQEMLIKMAGMMAEKMVEQMQMRQQQMAMAKGGEKSPGLGGGSSFQGNESANVPGVPPPVASVPPGQQI